MLMAKQNTEIVRTIIEEGWNRGNLEVMDEFFGRDAVTYDLCSNEVRRRGIAAHRDWVRHLRDGIAGMTVCIDDLFGANDNVVVRWVISGEHVGILGGVPPTGKPLTFGGITIFMLANGKVEQIWSADTFFAEMVRAGALGFQLSAAA
jgi:predicted ester cyclase